MVKALSIYQTPHNFKDRWGFSLTYQASGLHIRATRISTSCGYGVPQMSLVTDRATLTEWATKKGEAGLATYRAQKNRLSVDNLPGLGSDSSTLA